MKHEYISVVSCWRIIFTYIIMCFHILNSYGIKTGWYMGVEFFFIVSGYMLATETEKKRFDTPFMYTKHRILKFFPYYLFAFCIGMIVEVILNGLPNSENIVGYICELFFLDMAGLKLTNMINVPTWYLSVLIIGGFFVYFLLLNYKKIFLEFLAPLCILVTFSYLYRENGMLQVSALGGSEGIFSPIFARGISEICVGILIYFELKNKVIHSGNWFDSNVACLIRRLCFIIVIGGSLFRGYSKMDFIYFCFLTVGVIFLFGNSKGVCVRQWMCNTEKLIFSMYVNHNVFRELAPAIIRDCSVVVVVGYLILVTVYSKVTYTMIDKMIMMYRSTKVRLKNRYKI